jgi:hypothetical protein
VTDQQKMLDQKGLLRLKGCPGRPGTDVGPTEPAGYSTPSSTSILPATHPVSCGRNPIALSSLRSVLVVCSYGQHVDVKGDVDPKDVVHVVQESVVCAAQKMHATRATTVNSGLLWSIENARSCCVNLQKCR